MTSEHGRAPPGNPAVVVHDPVVTAILLIIFVAALLAIRLGTNSFFTDDHGLNRFGAADGLLIADGERWRWVTATFLHIDLWHLVLIGIGLWTVGRYLEAELGKARTFALFAGTAILANVGSFWLHRVWLGELSFFVGASGGIFGLMGVVVGLCLRQPQRVRLLFGHFLIALGFFMAMSIWVRVDGAQHAVGLLVGVAVGLAIQTGPYRSVRAARMWQATALLLVALCLGGFVLQARASSTENQWQPKYRTPETTMVAVEETKFEDLPSEKVAAAALKLFGTVDGNNRDELKALWYSLAKDANERVPMSAEQLRMFFLAAPMLGITKDEAAERLAHARRLDPLGSPPLEAPDE